MLKNKFESPKNFQAKKVFKEKNFKTTIFWKHQKTLQDTKIVLFHLYCFWANPHTVHNQNTEYSRISPMQLGKKNNTKDILMILIHAPRLSMYKTFACYFVQKRKYRVFQAICNIKNRNISASRNDNKFLKNVF